MKQKQMNGKREGGRIRSGNTNNNIKLNLLMTVLISFEEVSVYDFLGLYFKKPYSLSLLTLLSHTVLLVKYLRQDRLMSYKVRLS